MHLDFAGWHVSVSQDVPVSQYVPGNQNSKPVRNYRCASPGVVLATLVVLPTH
jgi:hypothetical protein